MFNSKYFNILITVGLLALYFFSDVVDLMNCMIQQITKMENLTWYIFSNLVISLHNDFGCTALPYF